MRALIFAAGRGERMRPLTDTTPKPLLEVGGKPLIVHHLERLAAAGTRDVVINTSYLAEQFPARLGDGARYGLRIHYCHEGPIPLETGGGMLNALPWLVADEQPFIVLSADVFTAFDFAALPAAPRGLAHLVLVDNPPHHPEGDFALAADDNIGTRGQRLTWSGIGVFRPPFLDDWRDLIGPLPGTEATPPRFKLRPLLAARIARGEVTGERFGGYWDDVGTPERLAAARAVSGARSHA